MNKIIILNDSNIFLPRCNHFQKSRTNKTELSSVANSKQKNKNKMMKKTIHI